jgi:hypothetical protein
VVAVVASALTVIIGIGAVLGIVIIALSRWNNARPLFLALFAATYLIIGLMTFRPGAEWLSINQFTTKSMIHWAIVGGISVPAAWLVGRAVKAELRRRKRPASESLYDHQPANRFD